MGFYLFRETDRVYCFCISDRIVGTFEQLGDGLWRHYTNYGRSVSPALSFNQLMSRRHIINREEIIIERLAAEGD